MATDVSSMPVNGTHGPHSGYDNAAYGQGASYNQQNPTPAQNSSGTTDIPKDEVGWYFVEQYYTTLSRSPDKLYLFYNKRSHFVLGDETEKAPVDVGQKAINERIKQLDFQDCKVRVTNVDAQASDANVVIQVIGEISNKSQPHRKFVQTFVLAGQTNGYFVLNDIFRYLVDEEEEPQQAEEVAAAPVDEREEQTAKDVTTGQTLTTSADPAEVEQSAQLVDKELESKASEPIPAVNGTAPSPAPEPQRVATPKVNEAATPEPSAPAPAPALETEKPKDPSPTPAPPSAKATPQPRAVTPAAPPASAASTSAPAPAPAPAKPSAPKTWANLAAAAHKTVAPAAPASQSTTPAPSTQTKAPAAQTQAPAQASTPVPAAAEPSQDAAAPAEAQDDEWTSVGDHRRQQSRAQQTGPSAPEPQTRGYIKNVHENIEAPQLRSLLEKFGELTYFDINRQKNAAFVDFKTPEAYKASVSANPHQLGNDRIVIEERRPKPGAFPYVPRGGMRGGRGGPQSGGRGAFQNGRGGPGFNGRGRGGPTNGQRGGRGGAAAQPA